MSDKQQKILEMAKDICRVKHICTDVCEPISACDALRYAERAVEAGYSKPEWISVEERLPERNGRYLIIDDEGYMVVASWYKDCGWFIPICRANPVTHWMPLPEAPKGGNDK